jgi:hypothetical protein
VMRLCADDTVHWRGKQPHGSICHP